MIIGLMGYAQSGKDTAAAELVKHHGYTRVAFADRLRDALYALDPVCLCTVDKDETGAPVFALGTVKAVVDQIGWDRAKVEVPTIRELLQRIGTEAGREIHGADCWVDAAFRPLDVEVHDYVFTDVRFPNEVAAIKDRGGVVWRIKRKGTKPVNAHASEIAVDHIAADYTINNDDDIKALHRAVVNGLFTGGTNE